MRVCADARKPAQGSRLRRATIPGTEATVKRFYRERGRIRLQPANSELQPIYVDGSRDVEVLGVVVGVYRRMRG